MSFDSRIHVVPGCTWMESTLIHWRYIHQSGYLCHPPLQCCHHSWDGITQTVGMSQTSKNSLLGAQEGRTVVARVLLRLISRRQTRKMRISLDTKLTVVCCTRRLDTSCWPGDSLPGWTARPINRHQFLSMMSRYTEPPYFHRLVSLAKIISLMCLSHSVHSPVTPHPAHITSAQSSPSFSPSFTLSTFHSRLKTHLFHKSFPP